MSADELLRKLISYSRLDEGDLLDSPEAKDIIRTGGTQEDAKLALQIKYCISSFDMLVFGKDNISHRVSMDPRSLDVIAAYDNYIDPFDFEGYRIFPKGLKDNLFECRKLFSCLLDNEARLFIRETNPSMTEAVILTAVHEVRHRVQSNFDIALISNLSSIQNLKNSRYFPLLKRYCILHNVFTFPEYKSKLLKEGEPDKTIKKATSDVEKDAVTITSVAATKLYYGTSFDELVEILQI